MGAHNHNAVLATTWSDEHYEAIRRWVDGLEPVDRRLFMFGSVVVNMIRTVVLMPDGSYEGLESSNRGDYLRKIFIDRLEADGYSDGSSPWSWVEVGYGEYGQKLLRGNNENRHGAEGYAL